MKSNLYSRQLHPEEKTLAKQLANKSGGLYTQQQIEDQMRLIGVYVDGGYSPGIPAVLNGQAPTDPGAMWISTGLTENGRPLMIQSLASPDPTLQAYIRANANSAAPGNVPSVFTYEHAPNQIDWNSVRNTMADAAGMISTNAGRVSVAAGAAAAILGPHTPRAVTLSFSSAVVSLGASGVQQMLNPQPWKFGFDSFVD
ncbi:hypothetical protein FAZ95_17815 [Trinickia violacea]|uniref:Uncharacterized protein n=1 Tax=Trinickia violacea TaxID=2571746 RepID=A0A4P8ISV9_9BURK|nr:hypothetical protein [Trinickia violacea]QCP50845.1 hypothetical protein FAZ95_17815 [Trinickia violacea]